jgi:hypothetical protein
MWMRIVRKREGDRSEGVEEVEAYVSDAVRTDVINGRVHDVEGGIVVIWMWVVW